MFAALIRIDAQDAAGTPVTVRFASHDLPQLCHLDDEAWFPAVAELGELAYDFFGGAFTSQVTTPGWTFAVDTDDLPTFSALRWADARVRLWAGDLGGEAAPPAPTERRSLALDFRTQSFRVDRVWDGGGESGGGSGDAIGPLDLWFDGELTGEPVHADDRVARFTAQVPDAWLDSSLLPLYAGTGGLEGPDDLEGQPKPLALGNLRFAGGTLIDRAENVWQVSFDGFDAASAAYDRVVDLDASEGDFASLAALVAADVTAGSWATCEADGLVKFGAPPDGKVAFDLAGDSAGAGGWVRKAGAMIGRVAELAEGTVNAASLTALDTARPYNLALQLTAQVSPREVIQLLADSVGAVPVVSWTGTLYVLPLAIGTPVATLAADGTSELAVLAVEEREKASPFWRLATEAEPTWVVFDQSEVALDYTWRGVWNADRLYRLDDVVTGEDGRTFAYINATAAAGEALPVAPATSNDYWAIFGAADVTAESTPRHEPGNTTLAFTATYEGVLDGGQLPETVQFKRYRGTTDVSSSATWSIVSQGAITGGTVTVSNGVVTIPDTCAIPLSTTITVRSVRDGFTIDSTIGVTRIDAAMPVPSGGGGGSGGGTSASDTSLNAVSGTTKIAVSDVMTVTTGSAGTITFAGSPSLSVLRTDPEGAFGVNMRWQYRLAGDTTWIDVGASDIAETAEAEVFYDAELDFYFGSNGSVNLAASKTGLTATTDYEVRLMGARDTSTPTKDVFFGGSVTATGS